VSKTIWKWIALVIVLSAVIAAVRLLPVATWLRDFNGWVSQLGALGFFVFVAGYVLATVLFVPGSVLTIGAGLIFGLFVGTVAVSLGSTIGAALAFLITRFFARQKVESMVQTNKKFAAIDKAIGEQGAKLIFFLRLSPLIPFNASNYFYGITAVKFWPYVLASWIGMLPATVLYVYLGALGKAGLQSEHGQSRSSLEWAFLGVGLVATLVVTIWTTRIARSALQKTAIAKAASAD
jgi:uncharacterized membrane protein YdjX (TVP38/TMEM64 family)